MLVFFGGSRPKVFCSAMCDSLHLCETVELRAVGNFPERFYARVGTAGNLDRSPSCAILNIQGIPAEVLFSVHHTIALDILGRRG
jgi:hypothetical protein